MDEDKLEFLRQQDWEDISARVMRGALILAARYGWDAKSSLPKGKSVEGLVLEAISDLFANPQRLKDGCTLVTQLRNIVKHKLWNLSQSPDGSRVARSESLEETLLSDAPGPESGLETRQLFERAIELIAEHPKIKGKSDHELVVIALAEGLFDTPDLIEATELSRDRIYQIKRELRDVYPSIKEQLQTEDSP